MMKSKVLKIAFAIAIAMVGGINVFNAQKSAPLSDVALANVEALADGETSNQEQQCYQVYTPADWLHADQIFVDCYTCTQKKGRNFDNSRYCNKPVY